LGCCNASQYADQPYTFDDLATIETMHGGIGIELIEVGYTHRQIGIGKQLNRFCFGGVSE
jgi:hypothetical protein